ncbi:ParB/RepB/Spo0J family partition protein [Sphingobium boeckii]|uniref:ParB family chromosome partitioning protein n=1 Tax=Sphingobium boeckii TaxID=1082345 RepID=A0A7W9AIJ9_9SPHN|nr:ParB N-terminal domain-containing protein [Sphingobium boeckii]MBB5686318.1 ParB family chromosome partitioning protein [Sphingobium boeckii]
MKLDFIPLDMLSVSKANMRHGRKAPDVTDILPSIRKRGILQPLIVRRVASDMDGEADRFEILGGRRRYHAACALAVEKGEADPVPCAILDDGDDASAIEASMIENMARLDPDEVSRWESFTRLVKEGQGIDEIAITFSLPELAVRRILALGHLLPRIRELYRAEAIDMVTVRHLTMASKAQQKTWLALADDPAAHVPTGHQLKAWLFGGQSIPVRHALFDLETYAGTIIGDLFGDERYFGDADAFWVAQNAEIEARRKAYLIDGWADVVVQPIGAHFASWDHEKAGKKKGGRIYVDRRSSGEILFHEGYVTAAQGRRIAKGDGIAPPKVVRPELSGPLQTYIDLHRHAAVRAELLMVPDVALRMMVAHAIVGSPLWNVRIEPQATRNDAIAGSVENSKAEAEFAVWRRAVLALLGLSEDDATVAGRNHDPFILVTLFQRLLPLPQDALMDVVAVVMGETLMSGGAAVEAVGLHLGVEMSRWWEADAAFFGLIRDKEVLMGLVSDVGGASVASANANEKSKVLKTVISDHLVGAGGRARVDPWVPRWMAFPPSAYTARGGVGTVNAHGVAQAARQESEARPQKDEPENLPLAA